MKRQFVIIAAAVAALFAVSCVKETPVETPNTDAPAEVAMREVTITASINPETKTSYTVEEVEGKKVGKFSWTKGDKIAIKGSDNVFYTFTTTQEGATASFVGSMPEGVSLQKHALYPAESASFESDGYFYTVPEFKDLSKSFSADIPMSSYVSAGTYNFVHMTGAAFLTFKNIPDEVTIVDISIKSDAVRLSGKQQVWSGTPFTFSSATAANDSEKTFTRRVSVADNSAQLYLPYKGEFWDNCTINIVGYDAQNNEYILLKDKKMKGSSVNVYEPGLVIPYTPLALPTYIKPVNWDAAEVVTFVNGEDAADDLRMKEIKAYVDADFLHVRVTATVESPFGANYLDVSFCDGEGANAVWWGWTTTGAKPYWKEHKGVVDENGNLTSMQYSHNGTYKDIAVSSEVNSEFAVWTLSYPREYVDVYKSSTGKMFVSAILWNNFASYWAIPSRGNAMLEVTLP